VIRKCGFRPGVGTRRGYNAGMRRDLELKDVQKLAVAAVEPGAKTTGTTDFDGQNPGFVG
jgi:hypothetical protein